GGSLGKVLQHIATAVGGGHIGAALQIVIGHMNFVARKHIAQKQHALAGVGRIGAVRKAVEQLGEVGEGLSCRTYIASCHVQRQNSLEHTLVLVIGCYAHHVMGVVHIAVLRVKTDKTVGGGDGCVCIACHIVGVNQFQLRLVRIGAEGEVL